MKAEFPSVSEFGAFHTVPSVSYFVMPFNLIVLIFEVKRCTYFIKKVKIKLSLCLNKHHAMKAY